MGRFGTRKGPLETLDEGYAVGRRTKGADNDDDEDEGQGEVMWEIHKITKGQIRVCTDNLRVRVCLFGRRQQRSCHD